MLLLGFHKRKNTSASVLCANIVHPSFCTTSHYITLSAFQTPPTPKVVHQQLQFCMLYEIQISQTQMGICAPLILHKWEYIASLKAYTEFICSISHSRSAILSRRSPSPPGSVPLFRRHTPAFQRPSAGRSEVTRSEGSVSHAFVSIAIRSPFGAT